MRRTAALASLVLALTASLLVAAPAGAAPKPPNPSNAQIAAAQQARQALAAQLGGLQARAAQLQGQILALQASADAAIVKYQLTTQAVVAAIEAADAAKADLDAANAKVDAARRQVQVIARDQYVSGTGTDDSTAGLLFSDNADVEFAITAASYLAQRKDDTLDSLTVANVAASNAEVARRDALAEAERLQRQADEEQQAALASLDTARGRQAELATTLTAVNKQAAMASAKLSGLTDLRKAYNAYMAEVARKAAAAEAARRAAAVAAANAAAARNQGGSIAPPSPAPSVNGIWTRPMTNYRLSSCYCARWGTFHHGVDLAGPYGEPIYSVGPGTVVASGPASGFGNWVVIDHHDGTYSIYGHMKVLVARVGQQVSAGILIAFEGSEGQSTGAHLHFEVRVGGFHGPQNSTDPIVWLRQRGVTL